MQIQTVVTFLSCGTPQSTQKFENLTKSISQTFGLMAAYEMQVTRFNLCRRHRGDV